MYSDIFVQCLNAIQRNRQASRLKISIFRRWERILHSIIFLISINLFFFFSLSFYSTTKHRIYLWSSLRSYAYYWFRGCIGSDPRPNSRPGLFRSDDSTRFLAPTLNFLKILQTWNDFTRELTYETFISWYFTYLYA